MASVTSVRVARRFVTSLARTAAIAHVDPLGNPWGWFADDTQRMHLVPVDPEHRGAARVWLEDRGVRCFKVDRLKTSSLDLDQLRASVSKTRTTVEHEWLRHCARKAWVRYSPGDAILALYPGTPNQLIRRLREYTHAPEYLQLDIQTNLACLEVRANRLIWWGADDGSDG